MNNGKFLSSDYKIHQQEVMGSLVGENKSTDEIGTVDLSYRSD